MLYFWPLKLSTFLFSRWDFFFLILCWVLVTKECWPKATWANRFLNSNRSVGMNETWVGQASWLVPEGRHKGTGREVNELWFSWRSLDIRISLFVCTRVSSGPVEMKIDIHTHILPKEWPDLEKVMVINVLASFWTFSRVSQHLCSQISLVFGDGTEWSCSSSLLGKWFLKYLVALISYILEMTFTFISTEQWVKDIRAFWELVCFPSHDTALQIPGCFKWGGFAAF